MQALIAVMVFKKLIRYRPGGWDDRYYVACCPNTLVMR
jgi:hypothetical protein